MNAVTFHLMVVVVGSFLDSEPVPGGLVLVVGPFDATREQVVRALRKPLEHAVEDRDGLRAADAVIRAEGTR